MKVGRSYDEDEVGFHDEKKDGINGRAGKEGNGTRSETQDLVRTAQPLYST